MVEGEVGLQPCVPFPYGPAIDLPDSRQWRPQTVPVALETESGAAAYFRKTLKYHGLGATVLPREPRDCLGDGLSAAQSLYSYLKSSTK